MATCETPNYCDPIIVAGAPACVPPNCGNVELTDPLWRTVRVEKQLRDALAQIGNINRLIADIQRSLFQGSSPSSLQNQITLLSADVVAAEADIVIAQAAIIANAAAAAAAAAANAVDIATNAADIATNVADIATNAADILAIQTNLLDEALAQAYVATPAASAAITATTYLNVLSNATIADSAAGSDFTVDLANRRITYTGAATKDFVASCTLTFVSSISNEVARFRLAENGTTNAETEIARKLGTGADVGTAYLQGVFTLATNDYIELWATLDASAADTITVENMTFIVHDLQPGI
jgi:hypothetical protein